MKIICDTCMKEVEILKAEHNGGSVRLSIRCHDRSEILDLHNNIEQVHVWSNLAPKFWSEEVLRSNILTNEDNLFKCAVRIQEWRRVIDGQGRPRIKAVGMSSNDREALTSVINCVVDRVEVLPPVSRTTEQDLRVAEGLYQALERLATVAAEAAARHKV